jgi:hypothetical protein
MLVYRTSAFLWSLTSAATALASGFGGILAARSMPAIKSRTSRILEVSAPYCAASPKQWAGTNLPFAYPSGTQGTPAGHAYG